MKRAPRKLNLHRFGYTKATPSKQRAGCLRMQSDTQRRASIKMGSKASAEQAVDSELDGPGSKLSEMLDGVMGATEDKPTSELDA